MYQNKQLRSNQAVRVNKSSSKYKEFPSTSEERNRPDEAKDYNSGKETIGKLVSRGSTPEEAILQYQDTFGEDTIDGEQLVNTYSSQSSALADVPCPGWQGND